MLNRAHLPIKCQSLARLVSYIVPKLLLKTLLLNKNFSSNAAVSSVAMYNDYYNYYYYYEEMTLFSYVSHLNSNMRMTVTTKLFLYLHIEG